jgi:hypothetical protein
MIKMVLEWEEWRWSRRPITIVKTNLSCFVKNNFGLPFSYFPLPTILSKLTLHFNPIIFFKLIPGFIIIILKLITLQALKFRMNH